MYWLSNFMKHVRPKTICLQIPLNCIIYYVMYFTVLFQSPWIAKHVRELEINI